MVQVVILPASGEKARVMKTSLFTPETVNGALVAKVLRRKIPAECIGKFSIYTEADEHKYVVWGWRSGPGVTNIHTLPLFDDDTGDESLIKGDMMVVSPVGDFTLEQWNAALIADETDSEEEDVEEHAEEEDAAEDDVVEDAAAEDDAEDDAAAEDDAEEDAEDAAEDAEDDVEAEDDAAEDDAEDADEDCYNDGEDAGCSKKRTQRKRTNETDYGRRMGVGINSKCLFSLPVGKRAPRWQSAPELQPE